MGRRPVVAVRYLAQLEAIAMSDPVCAECGETVSPADAKCRACGATSRVEYAPFIARHPLAKKLLDAAPALKEATLNLLGCLFSLAIFIAIVYFVGPLVLGIGSLLGFNTVSVQYGVTYLPYSDDEEITGVWILNPSDDVHSDARLELEFIRENGDVLKKVFSVDTINPAERWIRELDEPIANVTSISFAYTCDEGTCEGTLDVQDKQVEDAVAAGSDQRFHVPRNDAYPQSTPEECLRSMLKALDNHAYTYMAAHLIDLPDDYPQRAFENMTIDFEKKDADVEVIKKLKRMIYEALHSETEWNGTDAAITYKIAGGDDATLKNFDGNWRWVD